MLNDSITAFYIDIMRNYIFPCENPLIGHRDKLSNPDVSSLKVSGIRQLTIFLISELDTHGFDLFWAAGGGIAPAAFFLAYRNFLT
jgi:hypothetical protein